MSQSACFITHSSSHDVGQRLLVNPRLLVYMLSQEAFPALTDYLTGLLMIRARLAERLGCSSDTAGSLVVLLEGKGFLEYQPGPNDGGPAPRGEWVFVPDPERRSRRRRFVHRRAS